LADPFVREGARLTLQRRLTRLTKQQERAAAALLPRPKAKRNAKAKTAGRGKGKGKPKGKKQAAPASDAEPALVDDAVDDDEDDDGSDAGETDRVPDVPTAVAAAAAADATSAEPSEAVPEATIEALLLRKVTAQKSVFEGLDGPCSVEALCLQYYAHSGGWQGIHCESGGLLTLFGLLMWDVIFADVPDVFRSRFQAGPLDLSTDAFYRLRRNLVDARVAKIAAAPDPGLLVEEVYTAHRDELCAGVHWDLVPLPSLMSVARGLGGRALSIACSLLARDFRHWARGLPDLLLWHDDGRTKLVEVKGPRDRLSDIQRAWLAALGRAGAAVEVCHVRESESRPEWLAQAAQARRMRAATPTPPQPPGPQSEETVGMDEDLTLEMDDEETIEMDLG
jgi:hypothetical protein